MAKLPAEFVKAPAPRRSTKRRVGTTAEKTVQRNALALTGEVVVVLGDDERRALGAALDELRRAGEDVTIEQMVGRVIGDWMARRNAPPPAKLTIEAAVAHVVKMARNPIAAWRDLGASLRRAAAAASSF